MVASVEIRLAIQINSSQNQARPQPSPNDGANEIHGCGAELKACSNDKPRKPYVKNDL